MWSAVLSDLPNSACRIDSVPHSMHQCAILGSVPHWAGCAIFGIVRLDSMLGRSNWHGLCAVLSVLERIVKYRALFDMRN